MRRKDIGKILHTYVEDDKVKNPTYWALTDRQRKVVDMLEAGKTEEEIAEAMPHMGGQANVSHCLQEKGVLRYYESIYSTKIRKLLPSAWFDALTCKNLHIRFAALKELTSYMPEQMRQFLMVAYEEAEKAPEEKGQVINLIFANITQMLQTMQPADRLKLGAQIEQFEHAVKNVQQKANPE